MLRSSHRQYHHPYYSLCSSQTYFQVEAERDFYLANEEYSFDYLDHETGEEVRTRDIPVL